MHILEITSLTSRKPTTTTTDLPTITTTDSPTTTNTDSPTPTTTLKYEGNPGNLYKSGYGIKILISLVDCAAQYVVFFIKRIQKTQNLPCDFFLLNH